jgi:hypothetical protein
MEFCVEITKIWKSLETFCLRIFFEIFFKIQRAGMDFPMNFLVILNLFHQCFVQR